MNLVASIDAINEKIGRAVSWFTLLMVVVTIYDVLMRYLFKAGSIWIQEAEWHLFAANFMLAGAWTLKHGGHVRVDVLYNRFSAKTRAWIDILGGLLFLLPYSLLVIWASYPFVMDSWAIWEGSGDPGGLPARYILKTVIPLTFILIALQGVAEIIKSCRILRGNDEG